MAHIIVAGGGIGGLTVALCALRFGHEVTVIEQASELTDIGAGLQLSPNAMKVFEALDIGEKVAAAGFLPEAIELRMGTSGQRLIRMPLGPAARKRWGAPYIHIHRADLIAVLQQVLHERSPNTVVLGEFVTGYTQTLSSISAKLENSQPIQGDVLIGADGLHSRVRAKLADPGAPRFTGNVAWRAVVPISQLGAQAPLPVASAWLGRGRHAVTYLLRGGKLANFVGVVERADWTGESWTDAGDKSAALSDFADWHPTITKIIETADQIYQWALYDRAPLTRWTDGRAALLGDAAHPMLPFMAQGAAMAIEDAWALVACLQPGRSVPEALTAYQDLRLSRTTKVCEAARKNADTFHRRTLGGQLATYGPIWFAGRTMPNLGLSRHDWVYAYDITEKTPAPPEMALLC